MDPRAIAHQLCDEADDLLAGITKRADARAALAETVNLRHGKLPPADKKAILDQALAILDREGFFDGSAGDSGDDLGDFTEAPEV